MNQLIRQSTREDTAALADCYAFGVRSLEGLRNCSERAEVLKLHLMVAARLKWLPCTLAEVHDWVPTTPFDSSAIYRRPKTLGDVVMQDEYVRRPLAELFGQEPHFAVQPVDWPLEYGYVEGVPEWIRDLQQHNPGMLYDTDGVLGPGAPGRPDFYLEPEDELDACHVDIEDVRPGKNGMRATDNPETADDRVYRVVRNQEGLCAKEISERCGLTKKQANMALYRLERKELLIRVGNKRQLWFNTVDNPGDWMCTVRDMQPELDEISKARPQNFALKELTTRTRWGRNKVQIADPVENQDLSLDRKGEDNVLRRYDTHVTEAMGVDHVMGGSVKADFTTMDRKGDTEIRNLQESEAVFCLEGTELEGLRKAKQQAWNMLGETSENGRIDKTFIAAPTVGNGIAAARQRHFKIDGGVGTMTSKGEASLNYAAAKVLAYLQQDACDSGHIADLFDHISVQPETIKSKKWSKERFMNGLREAGIAVGEELPKRSFAVKPNEALAKRKPRGIISAGDRGVLIHIFDCATFERLIFHSPLFESRSIKHADTHEYVTRVGNFICSYDYTASTDFGAFDGSCTSKIRDTVENMISKRLLANILGDQEATTGMLREALKDRLKEACNMKLGAFVSMLIKDMIRESGDRGTSILNFLTNFTMFIAAAHMMMSDARIPPRMIDKIIFNALRTGELLNIMCEGDDGAMGFAKKYIDLVAGGDKELFGAKLVDAYTHFGFKLEPQGPCGEVAPCDALLRSDERLEFCSKVFICAGKDTFMYPKPSKFFQSLRVSFDTKTDIASAAVTKAISLMAGCIHCPIMYQMAKSVMEYWAGRGGYFDVNEVNEHSTGAKDLIEASKRYDSMSEISPQDQDACMVGLRHGDGGVEL